MLLYVCLDVDLNALLIFTSTSLDNLHCLELGATAIFYHMETTVIKSAERGRAVASRAIH